MMVSSRWGMCFHNHPTYPPLYSNSPTPRPDVGGVPDWLGRAAMGWSLRTPADGSLHRSGIEATSRFDTRHSPPAIPTHSAFAGRYHCALRLIPTSKVLAPTAMARYLRRCRSAYGSLRCNRVSAPQVALTPDWRSLCKPNAQSKPVLQRLMALQRTLNAPIVL